MSEDYGQRGPAVGYALEKCPECGADVIVTFQGYRVDAEQVAPAAGNVGLSMLPGGQVLMAGMGREEDNRYNVHDHQPEGLE